VDYVQKKFGIEKIFFPESEEEAKKVLSNNIPQLEKSNKKNIKNVMSRVVGSMVYLGMPLTLIKPVATGDFSEVIGKLKEQLQMSET
jgi:hypothetical protein